MNVLSSIAIVLRSVSPIGRPLLLAAVLCLPACAHTLDARPGRLIWGHEVREFTPCGTEQTLWFRGEGEILDPLIAQYQVLTDTPYEAIYVEVTGEVGPRATDGFAADYDGVFTIQTVSVVRATTDEDCRIPQQPGYDR